MELNKGTSSNISLVLEKDAGILLAKGNEKNIEKNITLEKNISAPISAGEKLGEISFSLDGNTLLSVNLISQDSVDKINVVSMSRKIYSIWFNLLR